MIIATLLSFLDAADKKTYILQQANDGSSALMLASRYVHVPTVNGIHVSPARRADIVVKCLLDSLHPDDRQSCISLQNNKGVTALMIACHLGDCSTVACLLDPLDPIARHDCIYLQNYDGLTALMLASRNDRASTIKYILETLDSESRLSCISQDCDGLSSLMIACQYGHVSTVKCFLDSLDPESRQSCIGQQDNDGWTALILACQDGHESVVKCLIDSLHSTANQSCISLQTNDGYTALMIACQNGHVSTVKCLLDSIQPEHRQSYISTQSNNGWTAVMIASLKGHASTAACLLDSLDPESRHICLSMQNNDEFTALMIACQNGHESTVKSLLDSLDPTARQACIFQTESDGFTPLMLTCSEGNECTIQRLMDPFSYETEKGEGQSGENILSSIAILLISYLDSKARYAYILHENLRGKCALHFASANDLEDSLTPPLCQKPFDPSSPYPHPSQNHSLLTHLLQELHSAQQSITPDEQQNESISQAFRLSFERSIIFDPVLPLRLLQLLPHNYSLTLTSELHDEIESYIRALFFGQFFLSPQPRQINCLLQILSLLSIRDANFMKGILSSITSMSSFSSEIESKDIFAWTLLQSWCQVLDVICDYPSLRENGQNRVSECTNEMHTCISTLSNMHLDTTDTHAFQSQSDIPLHDSPGFVPLKAAILQFVHHWQWYIRSASRHVHDPPSFPVEEPIYVTFWCELGSVMDVLPIPFLHELNQDICAHFGRALTE